MARARSEILRISEEANDMQRQEKMDGPAGTRVHTHKCRPIASRGAALDPSGALSYRASALGLDISKVTHYDFCWGRGVMRNEK